MNTQADFQKLVAKTESSLHEKPSQEERTALEKYKDMMSKAFDMGLHDAKLNPCTF